MTALHWQADGPVDGPPVVFLGALATDLDLWEPVMRQLPEGPRYIRLDLRGHGASPAPVGPYGMGALVQDVAALLDRLAVRDAIVVGACLGGLVAQGLAVKRLDQVRALVLTGTAARFGQPGPWHDRAATLRREGMAALANDMLPLWIGRDATGADVAALREMMLRQSPVGIAACCEAIAGTDFYTPTSGLRLTALGIAGTEDRFTPPDLQRETLGLIPGSNFRLMRRSGHLPMLDDPHGFATELAAFLVTQGVSSPIAK